MDIFMYDICMYIIMQVRKKKVIKSKNINHYKNDFIFEINNTTSSPSII